jgi:hypothetical protein
MDGRRLNLAELLFALLLIATSPPLVADPTPQQTAPRARLADLKASAFSELTFSPRHLGDGSTLTLVSPSLWEPLNLRLEECLRKCHDYLRRQFGELAPITVSVRLMEEEAFFRRTHAPRWTNALFSGGEITIPVAVDGRLDMLNLFRAARHEYTHAVVSALSEGRCPGWLDEGLAQWAEGAENPALQQALRRWLLHEQPPPFAALQNGFTKLPIRMVAAAYGESLSAVKTLIADHGFGRIRAFLADLRQGESAGKAFRRSFYVDLRTFEHELQARLTTAARRPQSTARANNRRP